MIKANVPRSPISSHTGAQLSTLLVICLVDDMLLQARPCSSQAPLQISDVEYGPAADTLLAMPAAPDFFVNWIQVRSIFSGHRSEKMKCSVVYV